MKRISFYLLLPAVLSIFVSAREVQSHGLLFEKWLRVTFFGGYEPKGYTQKWDIPASANKNHGNIPVNPKAAKHGTPIGLGDALRQFDIDEPFLLIAGFWRQETESEKVWSNVQAVRVEPAAWKKLWNPVTRADLEKLDAIIKDKALSLEDARAQAQALKSQPPFTLAIIQVNPKIDASQRRLQCSLRFADFFTHLASKASPDPQKQPTLFGVPVPRRFESTPRDL
ncbi:MAG: hypothetical protein JNG86_00930 [Verrucomicrobiaceae bacterium]|nr:hypothetical protein [Verrucomicrobiaceae bacterium]